ncbi:MAG: amino acid adenylation domain-containing protein, partial [Pseudomonadota bacterium]
CIHALFEQQVERTPEADAVVFGSEKLTYRQLNQRANQLAHYLRARGVGPEVLVGLCLERSPELIVGILGILKAGGAYVPLDPGYPQKRLDMIVADTGIRLMLTQPELAMRFTGVEPVLPGDTAACPQDNPGLKGNPGSLAYVIFTSGSTGRPKGVMIEQRALVNFVLAAQQVVQLDHSARLLSVTTISFDIFALELFLPLLCGAGMILASRETAMDGHALARLLTRSRATHLQATPTTWQMLVDVDWRPSDAFTGLCGGELLPRELAQAMAQRCTTLWNWYGPTEATVWATVLEVSARDYAAGNIGKPLSNYRVFILDGADNPVPIGVVGELAIGGDSLARGYFNQPDLTAARFSELGTLGRIYRTGDRARWRQDGQIEFLGRADEQLKVRGFRIEPGDIEACLLQHPDVSAAVVRVVGAAENRRLAAYIIARNGLSKETLGPLRDHVKQYLPDYMCPTSYTLLDRFPLTPNGKVDRQALPDPDGSRLDLNDSYVAPQTPLQQQLTEIWADVLGVDKVGIRDDFFELGGHSLLVLRLIARMEPVMGEQLSLLDMFQNPSIEAITRRDANREDTLPEAVTAIRATGSLAPFFAIGSHPRYTEVARRLDPDQPFYRLDVYALQTRQLLGGEGLLQSVEAIAAQLVNAILSIQPRGPYYLGGGCEGSFVALEVARTLQQRGEEVAQLVLWITPAPGFRRGVMFGKPALTRVLHQLRYQMVPELIADLTLRTLREAIRHARIEYRIFRAMDLYMPAGRFEGPIDLVRTA